MRLSDHFTLEELTASDTAERLGIDNTPPREVVDALQDTAARLEDVRALLNAPMHISSGYRSRKLNTKIGGSSSSAHMSGRAVDFVCRGFGDPLHIVREIKASQVAFDQLIQEGNNPGWVHISFDPQMRRQVLVAHFEDGLRTTYTLFK